MSGEVPHAAEPLEFARAARVPAPGDNVAIAVRTLPGGTRILIRQIVFEFAHTVLEGHRFALFRIRKGEPLLSWGLPFGLALRDIEPGEYVCNEKILRVLADRHVPFTLPRAPNFQDHRLDFKLDEARFRPVEQVRLLESKSNFGGFLRDEKRGAGTRNYVVILGVTSRAAGFARAVAARFGSVSKEFPNVDGVVAVQHTESGSPGRPLNYDLTLRTLAGFMVNPNIGAVLCVDFENEATNALRNFLLENRYPLGSLLHEFFLVQGRFETSLADAERKVRRWLPTVNAFRREALPLKYLRLGLQCGGSDAFSGVSANPLVGLLSRETVARGGSANLAETDELIGAESYVLEKVRDLETARAFLQKVSHFQAWAALHGHSAEGNPSGGNMYRGLYNITIKSIGAARKKDPATRLDYVIDFGVPMRKPGFYFMDSPGNDLESIAGQVAAGCNLILFATGNGSITNFPFVPTIKIMTTTPRFELVRNEMDFNAGRYLDGEPLEKLGDEAFDQLLRIASGERSAGERAGHSQVQLWREWRQDSHRPVKAPMRPPPVKLEGELNSNLIQSCLQAWPREAVELVLPTSLCAGQIAEIIALERNRRRDARAPRAVALPHTEGCGNSGGEPERLFMRTMAGYLMHPFVIKALLLEHGCEKTHNDAFRNLLRELNFPETDFGFASVQLDGGIERVTRKAVKWFEAAPERHQALHPPSIAFTGLDVPENVQAAFLHLARAIASVGGKAVFSEGLVSDAVSAAYGERITSGGIYEMSCPTRDLSEIITGLAATGAEVIIAYDNHSLVPSNPVALTLQVALESFRGAHEDIDLIVSVEQSGVEIGNHLLQILAEMGTGKREPRSRALRNSAFQITRGLTGISL